MSGYRRIPMPGVEVILIAATRPVLDAWPDRPLPLADAQDVVVGAGKVCYDSFAPGPHNLNLRSVRTDRAAYVRRLIEAGHLSVLEHVSFTFLLRGPSRVLTHELVRHRHLSFSQQSGRYVRPAEVDLQIPLPEGVDLPKAMVDETRLMARAVAEWWKRMQEYWQPWFERADMRARKVATSFLRRALPQAVATEIVVTGNARAWREVLQRRLAPEAEDEIRRVMAAVRDLLVQEAPLLFSDLVPEIGTDDDPERP